MASKSLSFLLFGEDVTAGKAFKKLAADAEASGGAIKGAFSGKNLLAVGALAAGLGLAVKAAANYQTQMTRLVTAAGESQKSLAADEKGVLAISAATGTSTDQLAKGLYVINSAGIHAATGLDVLKASAQGAKIEGADLGEVTNAVTSLLVDYHRPASDAAKVTSELVAAVGHGKTTFQELATALPNVAAAAAQLNVTLPETAAAIATMTMHGTDAAKAGTYLRQVLGQLGGGGSAIAREVMKGLGIDANHLALTLSSGSGHGLADAIQILEDGISKHLNPAGLVSIETFKKSTGSASDYQKMLANLPPALTTTFGALSKMTGGVKSMQGFLQLGGQNLATFKTNTDAVAKASTDAAGNVDGWAVKQQTLNQKLDELKQSGHAVGIELGTQLIPRLTEAADFTLKHKAAIELLVGGLVGLKVATVAVGLAQSAWIAGTALVEGAISGLETMYVAAMIAMDTAAGPVGLAIAGITVAVGLATHGFGLFGRSAHDQVKPVQALTDAIIADGDAFGALTRKQVENTLQTKGLYDAALKLGVGQGTLTAAAMGNQRALDLVRGAVEGANKAMTDNKRPATEYIKGTLNQTQASKDAYAAWMRSQAALKDQYLAASKLSGGLGALSGQMGASLHAANNLTIAEGKAKDAALTHAAAAAASSSKLQLESLAAQTVTTKLHGVHDAINTIPALKKTTLTVAAEVALAKLQSVHDLVNSIPRSLTINIGANNNVGKAVHDAVNSIPHIAAGGTVGGHGGPTSDDQLILASTGEEVIPTVQANKHRPLLKAIIAGKFAAGGTVGGVAAATQSTAWVISQDIPNMLAAVLGSPAALAAALSKLINDVHTAVTKNIAPDSLLKTLENENGQFLKLAAQRKYAASEVAAGTAKLNTLRASYAQELASVSSGVTSGFNLTSLGAGPGGPTTMGQLLALEQGNVNKAGAFAGNLGTLKGKGLTAGLISQLGNAGVGSAGDVAGILAGASAGDIKQLNALWAKDQSFGNLAGRQVAGADYGAGIVAASKFVNSWAAMSKRLDAESKAMGANIARQVAVNVHVTAGLGASGAQIAKDLVAALEQWAGHGGKIEISKAIR